MSNLHIDAGCCYHCGEVLPANLTLSVPFDDEPRAVCCFGCEAVMQAIIDADLSDYYRFRSEPAVLGILPEEVNAALDPLAAYDEPEISERYVHRLTAAGDPLSATDMSGQLSEVNLAIDGMRCGACVWLLERTISKLAGVRQARVNYSTARASIQFDPNQLALSQLLRRIKQIGYSAKPFDVHERELTLQRESRKYKQRLFISGIAMMQVMMYALPAYLSDSGDIDRAHQQLLNWAGLVLTTPVLLYAARPFLAGAWRGIRSRSVGMDVPVTIGIVSAFAASVIATVTGRGEVYFDSVSMFVFLLLLARYLEWSARCRSMRAIDDISAVAPERAVRIETSSATQIGAPADQPAQVVNKVSVPALRLRVGDIIEVSNGSRIPVDGRIISGQSAVDKSILSGESQPLAVDVGDLLPGGALLAGAPVQLRVEREVSDSTLSMIARLIERGASEKPKYIQLADQVAGIFVSVLLVFALAVFVIWLMIDPSRAASVAIAVLVVSCPCALSLATPAALAAATGKLLGTRTLITRGHALETLSRVSDVVFDKTGTLTVGRPTLVTQLCAPRDPAATGKAADNGDYLIDEAELLSVAATLAYGSAHPLAEGLQRAAKCNPLAAEDEPFGPLLELNHQSGQGISARITAAHASAIDPAMAVGNWQLRLGSAHWCGIDGLNIEQWRYGDTAAESVCSEVFLSLLPVNVSNNSSTKILARFLLRDPLRTEAISVITALRGMGITVHLLSGDRAAVVSCVASELGIERYVAAASPQCKQQQVTLLQNNGATVLMVGDGVNDAPVLASACVSLAVGRASALARTAADVISLSPGLEQMLPLLKKACQTRRIVRQNIVWAITYNAIAIPLAALGLVPPWAAAIGMACSSLLVACNALRLWSATPDRQLSTATSGRQPAKEVLWNRCSF